MPGLQLVRAGQPSRFPFAAARSPGDDIEMEEGKKKPSQQITIDQVRALDEFFNVGTHRGGLRIVLVNPTEAMNRAPRTHFLKHLKNHRQVLCF
jgi:hypothetical protein